MQGNYPYTRTVDVADDPYRWLEDADDPEVAKWVEKQRALAESVLALAPSREQFRSRLEELWDYPRLGVPFERGGRWFQFRNSGLQDQPVFFVSASPSGSGRPLLDPNELSADGTVAVTEISVSDDGSLLAYAISAGGSDWRTWQIRLVESGVDLPDRIEWSKFSGAAWRRDGSGFFYGALEQPEPGAELRQESRGTEIRFHRLGTPQHDDVLMFAAPEEPDWLPNADVTDDDRYLVVSITRGTDPEVQVRVFDLHGPDAEYHILVPGFSAKAVVVGNEGSTFYVHTDAGADRGRIVAIDGGAEDSPWTEVVPEIGATLLDAHLLGGKFVCHYLQDAHSVLRVHSIDGSFERDIPIPGLMSVAAARYEENAIEGRRRSAVLHFRLTSFSESGTLWAYNLDSSEAHEVAPSTAKVDPAQFVTEQVFATSDDGTRVPMFLTRRRDVAPTGNVPVILYGYGGFDIPLTPAFSVPWAVWLERGGMVAVANLRGGGEYGRAWYDGGRLGNKQRVFDDFCACARWLSASGWSAPHRTAITGGSNGGLLVGACLTQHPELFGAVVSDVGVFDMLRFHLFTIGWAWTSNYGNPDDPEQYKWLRAYSPLHNVRRGSCFPATMLMTGDHDDRVVPAHSYKFAAALQAAQTCDNAIVLRVETAAGHGQGKPTSKLIAESADRLTFLDSALAAAAPRA